MVLLFITILFFAAYAFLIAYYQKWWRRLNEYQPLAHSPLAFISIIVAVRNEEKNIFQLLQSLQQQTYPADLFEILIVDDFSDDSTASLVLKTRIPNLHLLKPDIEPSLSSKKKAIAAGVTKAKGELIVTTDADCIFQSDWLATINNFYQETGSQFIAAPVKLQYSNSFVEKFQAIDFLVLQGITAATVHAQFHSMCNGANLAYTKKAFEEVNGFDGIEKVATGDDMLLMYKIWKKYPAQVLYLKNKKAIVSSAPMHGWKALFTQRKRWASKTFIYDDVKVLWVLMFVYLFNCLFIVLLISGIFQPVYLLVFAAALLVKMAVEFSFVHLVTKFFDERKLLKHFILYQPLHILFTVVTGIISQWGKYEWKGRRTK